MSLLICHELANLWTVLFFRLLGVHLRKVPHWARRVMVFTSQPFARCYTLFEMLSLISMYVVAPSLMS